MILLSDSDDGVEEYCQVREDVDVPRKEVDRLNQTVSVLSSIAN
jgi:hypothetical protein